MITRSFTVMWRHKYLWLLALLGGADVGGGGSVSGNFSNLGNLGGQQGSAQVSQFLQDNLGLLVFLAVLALVVGLALFVLSCVTTGALVRASAEHDAERPFGLGLAWRAGLGTFWSVLGLRLVGLLFGLIALAVVGTFVVLGIIAYANSQTGLLAGDIAIGILAFLFLIVVAIVVGLVFVLALRAIVLEQRGTFAGLGRGWRLFRQRLGRVLLTWLLQIAFGFAAGIAEGVVLLVVYLPLIAIVVGAAVSGGATAAVLVAIPAALVVLAIGLLVSAVTGTYFSTFWTLAFRRLEVEEPPRATWSPPQYGGYPQYPPPG